MELSELYRAVSQRSTRENVFSRSSREEDDEEALMWAALEKLPTYNRVRKGIILSELGEHQEVDIGNLGFQEKKRLVNRLVGVAEEDNEKFLLKLKNRMDRLAFASCFSYMSNQTLSLGQLHLILVLACSVFRVGIEVPTIEVRFQNLNVNAEAHVGSRALPTIANFYVNIVEVIIQWKNMNIPIGL